MLVWIRDQVPLLFVAAAWTAVVLVVAVLSVLAIGILLALNVFTLVRRSVTPKARDPAGEPTAVPPGTGAGVRSHSWTPVRRR